MGYKRDSHSSAWYELDPGYGEQRHHSSAGYGKQCYRSSACHGKQCYQSSALVPRIEVRKTKTQVKTRNERGDSGTTRLCASVALDAVDGALRSSVESGRFLLRSGPRITGMRLILTQ